MTGSRKAIVEVLQVSTKLGLTSFGGPVAHLGYFHNEYVKQRQWIDESAYTDLVALCQFLPGPASSQVGISIGILRAGLWGGVAAWIGFTLPSAIALVAFAYAVRGATVHQLGWLHGLLLVAVAVVAQAVLGMARTLAPDGKRGTLAILSAIAILLWPTAFTQIAIILLGAVAGTFLRAGPDTVSSSQLHVPISRRASVIAWVLFGSLLLGLPILDWLTNNQVVAIFDRFYRAGSLVFGGGHVVLPLLQQTVVPPGWITNSQFLAGYGAAQAVPGPLFTFAAYLGAAMHTAPNGWLGATIALVAIFLPAFLLVVGTLPLWNAIRRRPRFQAALAGVNASVVGILAAALYNPVWVSAVHSSADFAIALAAFGLLTVWKLPPWMVVVFGVLAGMSLQMLR